MIASEKSLKKICLIGLQRFGDLVQICRALEGSYFKNLAFSPQLGLICRKSFGEKLGFLLKKHFAQIIYLDTEKIFSVNSLSDALSELKEFRKQIAAEDYDVMINLSFSRASEYLSALIRVPIKIGPYRDEKNFLCINDSWSRYTLASVLETHYNPFNLVDIFRKIIGFSHASQYCTSSNLFKREDGKIGVSIHPFSSQERKTWPSGKWTDLIIQLLKENDEIEISLLGSENERIKSEEMLSGKALERYHGRIKNLVGKFDLKSVFDHLSKENLFIGPDSLIGHLAALAGIRTITLSLGSVRPIETIPYGEGNYCISPKTACFPCIPDRNCSFYQCHLDLPYQVPAQMALILVNGNGEISEEEIESRVSPILLQGLSIKKSFFKGQDLELENIRRVSLDFDELIRRSYRIIWSLVLEDIELSYPSEKLREIDIAKLRNTLFPIAQSFELSEFGKKYSNYIIEELGKGGDKEKMQVYANRLNEIEKLSESIAATFPALLPLVNFYKVVRSTEKGSSVKVLAENSLLSYSDFGMVLSAMHELLSASLRHSGYQEKIELIREA